MNENNNGVDSSVCFDTKPEMCVNFKKGDPECSNSNYECMHKNLWIMSKNFF